MIWQRLTGLVISPRKQGARSVRDRVGARGVAAGGDARGADPVFDDRAARSRRAGIGVPGGCLPTAPTPSPLPRRSSLTRSSGCCALRQVSRLTPMPPPRIGAQSPRRRCRAGWRRLRAGPKKVRLDSFDFVRQLWSTRDARLFETCGIVTRACCAGFAHARRS